MSERTAFVSGAASPIGRVVVEMFAARGARVVVADLDESAGREVARTIDGATFVPLDVTRPASVLEAAARATSECGPPEILVNCTCEHAAKPFLETDETLWRSMVQINLIGVFRVTQALLPGMIDSGYGRLVNVTSDGGRSGSAREAIRSGCAGGVIAFTKTVARELSRHAITANTVCSGTPGARGPNEVGEVADAPDAEAMTRAIPLQRVGGPMDVAAAVAFFASEEAGYITGQTLSVSGGMLMV
jgi:2-hydroxycyclohexanecarboxyl-CoA dehydrogenase